MGLFNKKKVESKKEVVPTLPELPKLPELPPMQNAKEPIHQLPTFPNSSLGQKFSQDTIKDAVTGKKEGEEVSQANDFAQPMMQTMQKPLTREMPNLPEPQRRFTGVTEELSSSSEPQRMFTGVTKELSDFPERSTIFSSSTREAEPRFIRIDKFQESLQTFENAKQKISAIQNLLNDIKTIKHEEEMQLNSWEKEMQIIKQEIAKIDQNLFSKLQ